MRGYEKDGVVEKIRAAGGEIYAVTSEPHTLAREAHTDWATAFEHVGDPHQEIAGTCADRGWISLFTAQWKSDLMREAQDWISHPKGYYQPGVLVLSNAGRVLYRWRCRPTYSNTGGATARPTPDYVWRQVEAALAEPADAEDAALDLDPELDAKPTPWPLFALILLANGWFLWPRTFNYRKGQGGVSGRIRMAMIRLVLFVVAWIAAFFWLPTTAVALAFGAWLAIAVPGLRAIHQQFQTVDADEEPA